jgi:hypothetical protein
MDILMDYFKPSKGSLKPLIWMAVLYLLAIALLAVWEYFHAGA